MDSPLSARRMVAARAAYFGDALCSFCDHRNGAGARFCTDCGSPLDLKGCDQCDAVNSQAATSCYKCGAQFPALFTPPCLTPPLPTADPPLALQPTSRDAGLMASRANWRLSFLATILIAGTYAVYRINGATPDTMGGSSQPSAAYEHNVPTAPSAVPMAMDSRPVEAETAGDARASTLTLESEASTLASTRQAPLNVPDTKRSSARQTPVSMPATKRASTRQTPAPAPATKPASARQRPAPEQHASMGAAPRTLVAASIGTSAGNAGQPRGPDQRQAMHVSLASCGGDLIARIVCDQRARRRLCEGHWGQAPECASGIANDHGQ